MRLKYTIEYTLGFVLFYGSISVMDTALFHSLIIGTLGMARIFLTALKQYKHLIRLYQERRDI